MASRNAPLQTLHQSREGSQIEDAREIIFL
jgi:hypothetical protein